MTSLRVFDNVPILISLKADYQKKRKSNYEGSLKPKGFIHQKYGCYVLLPSHNFQDSDKFMAWAASHRGCH